MTDAEKRRAIETIAREAKRLEAMASTNGENFLAYLLFNAQLETDRILRDLGDD
jgi:hypothetical protein